MGKRSNTMEQVQLALALLRRIPRHQKVSAQDLRTQLADAGIHRDLRTIQRLLKALCEQFDIDCDYEKPHGYKWKDNANGFSVPGLSPRESLLLALAEKQLKPLLPDSVFRSLGPFFNQAQRNLGVTTKARSEREWLKKVRVVSTTQPLLPPDIPNGVFEAVSDALYGNFCLKVDYANASGGRTKGTVMPLGLAQQGPRLYLVCRFEGFGDNRILAIHRIRNAEVSTRTFERPKDFDLDKYADDGQFGFGEGKLIRLTFKIGKSAGLHLLETRLSTNQTSRQLRDHYEISATIVDSLILDQWLRSFGDELTSIKKYALALHSCDQSTLRKECE